MRRLFRPECVLLIAAGLLTGCGSTPRDEFIYSRTVTLRPQPGDGSRIASRWETPPARPTASVSTPVASVRED